MADGYGPFVLMLAFLLLATSAVLTLDDCKASKAAARCAKTCEPFVTRACDKGVAVCASPDGGVTAKEVKL